MPRRFSDIRILALSKNETITQGRSKTLEAFLKDKIEAKRFGELY